MKNILSWPIYCSVILVLVFSNTPSVLQVSEDPWGNHARQVRPHRTVRVSWQSCISWLQRRRSGSISCIDSYYHEPQLWSQLQHITNPITFTPTFWSRISLRNELSWLFRMGNLELIFCQSKRPMQHDVKCHQQHQRWLISHRGSTGLIF